jgi:hypothetical protein
MKPSRAESIDSAHEAFILSTECIEETGEPENGREPENAVNRTTP